MTSDSRSSQRGLDPAVLPDVAESCRRLLARASHVRIDRAALASWAHRLEPVPTDHAVNPLLRIPDAGSAMSAQFILWVNALNFCFGTEPWELDYAGQTYCRTEAMIAGLRRLIDANPDWLDARRWAEITRGDIESIFSGRGRIPLADRRVAITRETGRVLAKRFGGQCVRALGAADRDAGRFARLLATEFPSFRDVAQVDGITVSLLKRAQLCAAHIHAVWSASGEQSLLGIEDLTVFADYRLPQLMRHEGVLEVDPKFADRIRRGDEIPAGSPAEVELRAASIVVGEQLVETLRRRGRIVAAWQLDFMLWQRARQPDVTTPHHLTTTHFY